MEMQILKITPPPDVQIILGQSHFIKTVEDVSECLVSCVPNIKFGIGFCEASDPCLVRHAANDTTLDLGFLMMVLGSFLSGIWMLLIGWFLNSGAQSYLSQHELSSVLSHVSLREIMNTNIISVKQGITVNELLDSYFNIYKKTEFPVVDENGNLIGAVTTKQAMNVQKSSRDAIKVEEIMIPKGDLIVMKANASADEALKRIFRENKSRIFVYKDKETIPLRGLEDAIEVKEKERQRQKLIGLISKTDILNVAREREEFEKAVEKLGSSNGTSQY
jgi:CBS domain-containing protein